MCSIYLLCSAISIQAQNENVGIGTTTPAFKLDVREGSINVDSVYRIDSITVLAVPGSGNLFVGKNAGRINTGSFNTFSGDAAGYSNTSGYNNSFFGQDAGRLNMEGLLNSFFGTSAGFNNANGRYNSFFGSSAGYDNSAGEHNSFFGRAAGLFNSTGHFNSFFGRSAGYSNITGTLNTALGYFSNVNTVDLTNTTAIGANARVDCSNCMVLGSVNNVNGATSPINVGIGVNSPDARLSISSYGTELAGTAASTLFRTNAGILGDQVGDEISLANIGFASNNNSSLGIRAYRSSPGTGWEKTAIVLGMDVDNTVRVNSGFVALNANGNVGIGTKTPVAKLEVSGQVKITGGTPGAGKILTSDATGLASWQPPPPPPPTYYQSVSICCQSWMTKNLDITTYRNGDPIPKVTDQAEWGALTTGAYCYNNNDSTNYAAYGKLYNWYAVNDPRGLAPEGWHIPTDFEWTTLGSCLGGDAIAGGPMKELDTLHWAPPNYGATNLSGFTGLAGSYRDSAGSFYGNEDIGIFWSSTEFNTYSVWYRYLASNNTDLTRNYFDKGSGFSVRCLRD